jgi:uncharacterized membrane protein YcaP (DUF421 family)
VQESVVAFDLQRMLIGDAPLLFHLEVVVRTAIVYAYALALLRWLGSRTIGQLSTVEFLLVIALGSAVGDPMFYPDVPLLHALVVVTVVVLANKGLDILIAASKSAERIIDGEPVELIDSGVISRRFLRSMTLGRSEIFQQLRHRGIRHLGQVRFAFIEPDGAITLFRNEGEAPAGLPIVPPWEVSAPRRINADDVQDMRSALACMNCGTVKLVSAADVPGTCPHCEHEHWTPATPGDDGAAPGAFLASDRS